MPARTRRPLSEKPSAVRSRMRKSTDKINRDIGMLYQKPIEDWDMEELAKGRPRGENGKFQGPRPTWITPIILKQAQDRLRSLTRAELSVYAGDAVRVMHELMTNTDTDFDGKPLVTPSVKLQSATYILDQLIGKATTPVEVTGNVVLQTLMDAVLVNDEKGERAHPVIEGEVVEEEPEDDEDDEDGGA